MIGLVISNQRGGVGKTTTAVNLAGFLIERKRRTLLIDADSQGSIATYLGLRPERFIADLIIGKERLSRCITQHSEYLDVLCSNRETQQAEAALLGQMAREMALKFLLKQADEAYEFVIIDVAPSITLLQTCGLIYARNMLIPLDMDMLSLQGAQMASESTKMVNEMYGIDAHVVGFLPTQVNRRHQVTDVVSSALSLLSKRIGVPIFSEIRTDQTVHKAARQHQFLFDYDPKCKAAEDYLKAFEEITKALEARNGQAQEA